MKLPAVFLSHGAPTLAVEEGHETRAWAELAASLPRPRSILAVSAHWDTRDPEVSAAPRMETIHDFNGFPRALYEQRYPAPGAPDLARQVATRLQQAGYPCEIDPSRGLDHGAWVPLKWMYPKADIPVTQLSVQSNRGPEHHLKVGQAIAPLTGEAVLVLATGGIVHNLGDLEWDKRGTREAADWARQFNDWIAERVERQAVDELLAYRGRAPNARRSHPTEDHFAPFFVALGAGGFPARRLDLGFDLGTLGLDGYVFGG
ncbi:MAG: dioxygenase [Burkholderiales bacterium]|nr:dioxygenase [Burkholderiales bacterium]